MWKIKLNLICFKYIFNLLKTLNEYQIYIQYKYIYSDCLLRIRICSEYRVIRFQAVTEVTSNAIDFNVVLVSWPIWEKWTQNVWAKLELSNNWIANVVQMLLKYECERESWRLFKTEADTARPLRNNPEQS